MKDLKLDTTTNDLIVNGALVVDKDHVRQALKIRLQFFLGEWFLDLTAGVPYYQTIFKKQPRGTAGVDAALKSCILGTPGVNQLTFFSSNFDRGARMYSAEFVANTIYGEDKGIVTTAASGTAQLPSVVITDNIVLLGA